jgi:hypothetical protein
VFPDYVEVLSNKWYVKIHGFGRSMVHTQSRDLGDPRLRYAGAASALMCHTNVRAYVCVTHFWPPVTAEVWMLLM